MLSHQRFFISFSPSSCELHGKVVKHRITSSSHHPTAVSKYYIFTKCSNMNSTASYDFKFDEFSCLGKVLMTCCCVVIFITGTTGNSVVLNFFRSQRNVRRLSTDKLFLLNICYNNLIACCISLPIHYMDFTLIPQKILPQTVANCCLCLFRLTLTTLFGCLGVGFSSSRFCFDRYETLVKYNQSRLLTPKKAFKVTVVSWITAYVMIILAMTGFAVDVNRGSSICMVHTGDHQLEETNSFIFSSLAIIVVVTVWLTSSNIIILFSLYFVSRQIKHHMVTVRDTLGTRQTLREIKLVRQCCSVLCFGLRNTLDSVLVSPG